MMDRCMALANAPLFPQVSPMLRPDRPCWITSFRVPPAFQSHPIYQQQRISKHKQTILLHKNVSCLCPRKVVLLLRQHWEHSTTSFQTFHKSMYFRRLPSIFLLSLVNRNNHHHHHNMWPPRYQHSPPQPRGLQDPGLMLFMGQVSVPTIWMIQIPPKMTIAMKTTMTTTTMSLHCSMS